MLIVPSITPFKGDLVNHAALERLTQFYRHHRVPALFPLGTTGEFSMLSLGERKDALETFVQAAEGQLEIIAHIGATSTREVLALGEHALSLNLRSAAVVTPYYFHYSQSELELFYREVCTALPSLRIYGYTIPQRTGNTLELSTLRRLMELENFVGIKDSSGDMNRLLDLLELPDFEVFAGADSLALPFMQHGGRGLVSGLGSAIPEIFHAFTQSLESGSEGAQNILYTLIRRFNALMKGGSRLDYIRTALEWRGLEVGQSRAPLPQASGAERDTLVAQLEGFSRQAEAAGFPLEQVSPVRV